MRAPSGDMADTDDVGAEPSADMGRKRNATRTVRVPTSIPTTRPKPGLTAQSVLPFGDNSIAHVVAELKLPDPGRSMQRAADVFRLSWCTIAPPLEPT